MFFTKKVIDRGQMMYRYTDGEMKEIMKKACVVVNKQEQKCDHILKYFEAHQISYCKEKLVYGDYTLKVEMPSSARPIYLSDVITIKRIGHLNELSILFSHERNQMIQLLQSIKGQFILLIEQANYEDIICHHYDTRYTPKSFLATLKSFENRYHFNTHFQKDTQYSGHYIYETLIYALRNKLKEGAF